MASLIVGHVSETAARIWVRGDKRSGVALLRYRPTGSSRWQATSGAPLLEHLGYVAVIELAGLSPSTSYECELSYQTGTKSVPGSFTTAPAGPRDICFLLGSCNWTRVPLGLKDPEPAWERIEGLAAAERADFMIHCGDQIYADIPTMSPFPDVGYYRRQYQEAWKPKPTARVLASLPNYMILDDHEIFDGFANDAQFVGLPSQPYRDVALAAYREYQHSHNPQTWPAPALYYAFGFGGAEFFVMDVRTERYRREGSQIVSALQMERFKQWLGRHADRPKFVVSSIPFVAEVRDRGDKWCGDAFRSQREEIIDAVAEGDVGGVVFLTGDMHCSCHATMSLTSRAGRRSTIHELMSSPINQFGSGLHAFTDRGALATAAGTAYRSQLAPEEFYGAHSNVMVVRLTTAGTVSYSVFRTKTEGPPVVKGRFQLPAVASGVDHDDRTDHAA
jgi:phosphodiesterase/alkaline phosphatase D-like protein